MPSTSPKTSGPPGQPLANASPVKATASSSLQGPEAPPPPAPASPCPWQSLKSKVLFTLPFVRTVFFYRAQILRIGVLREPQHARPPQQQLGGRGPHSERCPPRSPSRTRHWPDAHDACFCLISELVRGDTKRTPSLVPTFSGSLCGQTTHYETVRLKPDATPPPEHAAVTAPGGDRHVDYARVAAVTPPPGRCAPASGRTRGRAVRAGCAQLRRRGQAALTGLAPTVSATSDPAPERPPLAARRHCALTAATQLFSALDCGPPHACLLPPTPCRPQRLADDPRFLKGCSASFPLPRAMDSRGPSPATLFIHTDAASCPRLLLVQLRSSRLWATRQPPSAH